MRFSSIVNAKPLIVFRKRVFNLIDSQRKTHFVKNWLKGQDTNK